MKKQTKVLLAATLLTLGASFSSMAAQTKGTWVLNEEGWQYVDKEGEFVSNEWCKSYGVDYWVNDDEVLGSSQWVADDDGYNYYVQSDGSKAINAWKYLYDIEDEEEEEDQYWYYFDAKGRMLKNTKKTIGNSTYYFNEDGQMLTGWVDTTGKNYTDDVEEKEIVENLVYCDENGALVKSSWLEVFPWSETDGYEGEDEEFYYAKKDGAIANSKTTIDGLTYFFNKNTGVMIEGWVKKVDKDTYTATDAIKSGDTVYWTNETGYAVKNTWKELEHPEANDDVYWYHFNKLGEVFHAEEADVVFAEATFTDGEDYEMAIAAEKDYVKAEILKINGKEFYFNEKGEMIDGLQFIVTENGNKLVYLVDGTMQTGKVTLTDEYENDYTFMFAPKTEDGYEKYVAVNGAFDGYAYVRGQLVKAEDEDGFAIADVDGNGFDLGDFIVDANGKIQKKTTKEYFTKGETYTFATKAEGAEKNSVASIVKAEAK